MARDEDKKPTRKQADANSTSARGSRARSAAGRTTTQAPAGRSRTAQQADKSATKTAPKPAARSRSTAAKPTASRRKTAPAQGAQEPSYQEIAEAAYHRWRETGNEDALENWVQAERDLRAQQLNRDKG